MPNIFRDIAKDAFVSGKEQCSQGAKSMLHGEFIPPFSGSEVL